MENTGSANQRKMKQINIGNSDAWLQPGKKATMVIVDVITTDGRKITFPFSAEQKINDLLKMIEDSLNPQQSSEYDGSISGAPSLDTAPGSSDAELKEGPWLDYDYKVEEKADDQEKLVHYPQNPKTIERRDLVVFDPPPSVEIDEHSELVRGGIYRVLDITMKAGRVTHYAVIDDQSRAPIRLTVNALYVHLKKKADPLVHKRVKHRYELMAKCDECRNDIVIYAAKEDLEYTGTCAFCGCTNKQKREVSK